jgi:hypothetical protein
LEIGTYTTSNFQSLFLLFDSFLVLFRGLDTHGTYNVVWDDAGRLREVVAPTPIRFRVLIETAVEQQPAAGGGPVQLKDLEGLLPRSGGDRK